VIVDTSAVLAMVFREPVHTSLIDRLLAAPHRGIGAPTLAETGLVLAARLEREAEPLLARFLQQFELATVAFGDRHWRVAVEAFQRYGRGRHPAALNFGDCLSYAVAKLANRPLLYVGDDFARTDLPAA
jgi:ribonuclease VapC